MQLSVLFAHDYILLLVMDDNCVSHVLFWEVIANAQFNLVSVQEFSFYFVDAINECSSSTRPWVYASLFFDKHTSYLNKNLIYLFIIFNLTTSRVILSDEEQLSIAAIDSQVSACC